MLEVRGLSGGYGGAEVLRGIAMTVGAGEIVTILGSNGVGKTTLNLALSGLLPQHKGEIRFSGVRIDEAAPAAIVAAGLIHVPEGRKVFPNMSVRENLELGSYRRGRARRRENLARVFSTFPRLAERARQAAGTLSGGEQQMLAIGRGLMLQPTLLMLDEPSLGIAPKLVDEIFATIRGIAREGMTILLVEQNVRESLELADRAYALQTGRTVLAGTGEELLDSDLVREAYLGL